MRDKVVVLPVGGEHVTRTLELLLKERRTDQVYHPRDFHPLVIEDIKVSLDSLCTVALLFKTSNFISKLCPIFEVILVETSKLLTSKSSCPAV